MSKFCGKCGGQIDEKTGLCPNCDADKLAEVQRKDALNSTQRQFNSAADKQPKLTRKQKKAIKKANRTTTQKVRSVLIKLLVVLLVVLVLISGLLCVLVYYNAVEMPMVSNLYDQFNISYSKEVTNRNIPETDTSGIEYSPPKSKEIVSLNGVYIIDSEVLILTDDNNGEAHIKEFFKNRKYEIVGKIEQLNQYQVKFRDLKDNTELSNIVENLKKEKWVLSASLNYVSETDTDYYKPNDYCWKNIWGDYPEGLNWGAEAINAPEAWESKDEMSTVNVGLIDSFFDVEHEDLLFSEQPLGNAIANKYVSEMDESYKLHGSHVAGTMAASFDNKKGISGICPKTNLYGVSMKGIETQNYADLMGWKVAFSYLAVQKKCKVINISMGENQNAFEASRGTKAILDYITDASNELGVFLKTILSEKDENGKLYDFVICKSAGNQSETDIKTSGYLYFLKDEDDNYNPSYRYHKYSDLKKYVSGDVSSFSAEKQTSLARYVDRYNSDTLSLDTGRVDAKYDIIAGISVDEVKNRTIVVGAVKNNGTHKEGGFFGLGGKVVHGGYEICNFSQCGNRVDVLAPGDNIHSVKYGGGYIYKNWSGTSQATPHVSGVAGMVFALKPEIKGDEVKKIIKESSTGSYGTENYGLLNANNAVTRVIGDNLEKQADYTKSTEPVKNAINSSAERDVVLVLDASGSMDGSPLEETKKAATKFVDTVLGNSANIGIVKYDGKAEVVSPFSTDGNALKSAINDIGTGGSTNIEDGLSTAESMLSGSSANKKIIVLMSDGEPNNGKVGDELIAYANELKNKDTYIYTLGFFESISDKTNAQYLMEKIASDGCHYEVSDADSLVYFFGDIADQINGQKYIYVRIACPVDVSVSYNGETLNSAESSLITRTSFGSLTFEDTDTQEIESYNSNTSTTQPDESDEKVKILRLKEGEDYDIKIEGTGKGRMNYSIGFMDENGEYSDFRKFNNVKITRKTQIDTVAKVSDKTVLNVDEDGDGKYDLTYEARANSRGEIVDNSLIVNLILILLGVLVLLIIILIIYKKVQKSKIKKSRRDYNG